MDAEELVIYVERRQKQQKDLKQTTQLIITMERKSSKAKAKQHYRMITTDNNSQP